MMIYLKYFTKSLYIRTLLYSVIILDCPLTAESRVRFPYELLS